MSSNVTKYIFVLNLSFSLYPTIKLEELQNSFPELPSWIAQQYLTQFEQQVNFLLHMLSIPKKMQFFFRNHFFNGNSHFVAKNNHFSLNLSTLQLRKYNLTRKIFWPKVSCLTVIIFIMREIRIRTHRVCPFG